MIAIIDYGMSNLDSVERAIALCGGDPVVIDSPRLLDKASAIVLPGVGAFRHGMESLRARGFVEALTTEVQSNRIPLLGICLGMQLLAERGFEGACHGTDGLGWIGGSVEKLPPTDRVPHVGWNEVHPLHSNPSAGDMFRGLEAGRDFYFVHSYRFAPSDDAARASTTPYGGGFCSAVARDHVWGVQFHPEKSQRSGFKVLENFIEAAC